MTRPFRKEMPAGPDPSSLCYHIKTHGGIGDIVWAVGKKLSNLPHPLFVSISNEHRARPRRAGYLVDHLPNVVGWRFDDTAFTEEGNDWPDPGHPACMIDTTWHEQDVPLNVPVRVECNRWLEGARRIEGWLPDLPTTHHFAFDPVAPPTIKFKTPCVVLHVAGWVDVPDLVWAAAADLFRPLAHVYVVGGSYDKRPRHVMARLGRATGVSLLEDVPFEDLIGVLRACDYCFGHASGFTALADVLKVPGATFNPRAVPRLIGTWNSPDHPAMVHVDRVDEFQAALAAAYRALAGGDKATWPAVARRGVRVAADPGVGPNAAVRAAAGFGPKRAAVWAAAAHDPGVAAALLDGAYARGGRVESLTLVGCSAEALAAAYREARRTSRPPPVEVAGQWAGAGGGDAFDLVVVLPPAEPARAADMVRAAWAATSPTGTVLVGSGPAARAGLESLASGLGVAPREVQDAPGWYYLHRRL